MTGLRRRLARETDALLPLEAEITEADTRGMLASPHARTFVALEGSSLVGVLGMLLGAARRNAHVARVWVGVVRCRWGRGIAGSLFEAAQDHARAHGIRRLELSVHDRNTRALALYRRLGLTVEGRRPASLRLGDELHDELWLSKLLPAP